MKHCVYIIRSQVKTDEYYSGQTDNVQNRLTDHNSGKSKHTAKYKPWQLVFHCWFDDPAKAAAFEKYLKSGSGRAFAAKRLR